MTNSRRILSVTALSLMVGMYLATEVMAQTQTFTGTPFSPQLPVTSPQVSEPAPAPVLSPPPNISPQMQLNLPTTFVMPVLPTDTVNRMKGSLLPATLGSVQLQQSGKPTRAQDLVLRAFARGHKREHQDLPVFQDGPPQPVGDGTEQPTTENVPIEGDIPNIDEADVDWRSNASGGKPVPVQGPLTKIDVVEEAQISPSSDPALLQGAHSTNNNQFQLQVSPDGNSKTLFKPH